MTGEKFKRATACKIRLGDIKSGKPVKKEEDKLDFVLINNEEIRRVNVVANIIERFDNPGEKKYTFLTIDDASGQLSLKIFGEDVEKFKEIAQGDTVMTIGKLREYKEEIYVQPKIIKKKDPRYLLVRKLELENLEKDRNKEKGKSENKEESKEIKNKIIDMIRDAEEQGGIETDKIIMELDAPPEVINEKIQKLLEEGLAYEPKPGKIRYLG